MSAALAFTGLDCKSLKEGCPSREEDVALRKDVVLLLSFLWEPEIH